MLFMATGTAGYDVPEICPGLLLPGLPTSTPPRTCPPPSSKAALVAAYPIIERIWLHDYLSSEVIHDHSALERAAESGSDQAVDAVLRGQRHRDERTAEGVVLPSNRR
jgi:hypothetical protein